MIGVVVATHGKLAQELIRTAEGVVGPLAQTQALEVAIGADTRAELRKAISAIDQGAGVVLLTDLLGGSTTNVCLSLLADSNVEVVTGVNLPMLLKLNSLRAKTETVVTLARELALAGQKAIVDASDLMREKKT
jgi:PTS system mannose-specific IIA component